ncbi:hypothetical protein F4818DRAFT_252985 [Hypoxylon cercidicola]|nr:hypothetical protein F4818DRAFT_252985 [Hypoxylon cercidicola]
MRRCAVISMLCCSTHDPLIYNVLMLICPTFQGHRSRKYGNQSEESLTQHTRVTIAAPPRSTVIIFKFLVSQPRDGSGRLEALSPVKCPRLVPAPPVSRLGPWQFIGLAWVFCISWRDAEPFTSLVDLGGVSTVQPSKGRRGDDDAAILFCNRPKPHQEILNSSLVRQTLFGSLVLG